MKTINLHYLPKTISKKDKKKQYSMLMKSRKMYKKNKYYTRKNIKSFKSHKSSHITDAEKKYNIESIGATLELSKKTGCSINALKKNYSKGRRRLLFLGFSPQSNSSIMGYFKIG